MSNVYTPKQRALLRLWQDDKLKRINLLEGSVSSGKTWISLVLWAFWVGTMPGDGSYLMAAKTLTSLRRNCLDVLEALVGTKHFTYSISRKEAALFGRKVYLEGVNDVRAENKIRGLTLTGAYCDEVTLFTEDFFEMLLSRLRKPGAKLIATTNPDNPGHWLMQKYISRKDELDMMAVKFLIDDNTFLPPDYVSNLKKEYTGVFYDRYILGLWKPAEGVIYQQFADNPEPFLTDTASDIAFATIGVDFGGNKSAHAFVLNGYTKGLRSIVTLDEYYRKDRISPSELEAEFIAFVRRAKQQYQVYDVYCDSAETTLIEGLRAAAARAGLAVDVRLAKKGRITDRIRFYNALMSQGRYRIMRHCIHVQEALKNAVWDDKSIEDKRKDDGTINVDSLDALEYAAEAYMRDMIDLGAI